MKDCIEGARHQYHHRHVGEEKNCRASGGAFDNCLDYYINPRERADKNNKTVREESCSTCGRVVYHESSGERPRRAGL